MHTSFKSSIVAAVTAVAASGAFAQKAGDDIVSVGLASIHPSTSLGKTTSTSSDAYTAAAFNASDRSQTDNNWDFTALAAYTVDSNLDVEFGFTHKVRSPNLYERYTWASGSMAAIRIASFISS